MRHNQKGQSLVEVIVAATVGILVVSALTFATIFSLRNANFSKNSSRATKLAQEGIEKVRTLRDRDGALNYSGNPPASNDSKFSELWPINFSCPGNCYFYFNASGVFSSGTSVNLEPILPSFQRQILLEDVNSDQKKVTVIVRWTDSTGPHESKLTTILRKL